MWVPDDQTSAQPPRRAARPAPSPLANRNLLAATALLDELVRCGVQELCLSPGSRSAPIALAAAAAEGLTVHPHVDERASAFFALGLARAARRPVALLCSSGSAGANMHPAVVEAFESGVPLVLITADRPPELLDCGAPQTTEQRGLFGPHVRRFQRIDPPRAEARWLRWLRSRTCRLVEAAMGPPTGPVHLDLHLDEPLTGAALPGDVPGELPKDDPIAVFGRPDGRPFAEWAPAELRASGAALDRIGRLVREQAAGVIVVGPLDASDEEATAIPFLADALRVPVLADPLSGLRRPAHGAMELITTCDAALRSDRVAAELRPAWILRIGRLPTSGPLVQWMARHGSAELVVVDDQGRWEDPNHTGALFVRARAAAFCGVLGTAVRGRLGDQPARSRWLDRWRRLEEACAVSLDCAPAGQLLEDSLVRLLTDAAPSGTVLHVASSMPVRELDSFLRPGAGSLRVLASRGVNGIDGQVSTALGVAAAGVGPTWALLGDLSTLHDLGGLAAAARLGLDATLVVVNNGGGAIFEYLPLADTEARLDELFVASHDLRFEQAAAMYGLEYLAPENEDALLDALARPASGVRLIELAVDRQASVAWHRELWTRASAAAEAALGDTR